MIGGWGYAITGILNFLPKKMTRKIGKLPQNQHLHRHNLSIKIQSSCQNSSSQTETFLTCISVHIRLMIVNYCSTIPISNSLSSSKAARPSRDWLT